jgi:putative restriction endonuclease
MRELTTAVLGARLDESLYTFLLDAQNRVQLRRVLLVNYFDKPTQDLLSRVIARHSSAANYAYELWQGKQPLMAAEARADYVVEDVRSQGFRRAVVKAYENRCAICGIRLISHEGHTAVEAAHIIPWAETQNDSIQNGLSLCRLCHWSFDNLIVSIDSDHTVMVSTFLTAAPNYPGHLATFTGRSILLPSEQRFVPLEQNLAHHRRRFREVS